MNVVLLFLSQLAFRAEMKAQVGIVGYIYHCQIYISEHKQLNHYSLYLQMG